MLAPSSSRRNKFPVASPGETRIVDHYESHFHTYHCPPPGHQRPRRRLAVARANHNGISAETGLELSWDDEPETLWRAKIGEGYSSVVIHDHRLYTMGLDAKSKTESVRCLDAKTGAEMWPQLQVHVQTEILRRRNQRHTDS